MHSNQNKHLQNNSLVERVDEAWLRDKLSLMDDRQLLPGVSIVSCSMNRSENLAKALVSWLALPVNEIIIVDWSSTIPLIDELGDNLDDRIKIIRVEKETSWMLTLAFNVGLRAASYEKIYKLDADIVVAPDFLSLNSFSNGEYIRGSWQRALDEGKESQIHINGSFGAYKKDLLEIGFYNELIRSYGWDDSDLYERLSSERGLAAKVLNLDSLTHVDQECGQRLQHQSVSKLSFLGKVQATEFNNYRNRFIGRTTEYWTTKRLQDYELKKTGRDYWSATRTKSVIELPAYLSAAANIYASLHFVYREAPYLLQQGAPAESQAEFLYCEYQEGFEVESTQQLWGVGSISNSEDIQFIGHPNIMADPFELMRYWQDKKIKGRQRYIACFVASNFRHFKLYTRYGCIEILSITISQFQMLNTLRRLNSQSPLKTIYFKQPLTESLVDSLKNTYPQKKIYVDAQHGLGNRLRAIASGAAVAENTGRELVIVWEPDHHCDCTFSDLFDYSGPVLNKSFISKAIDSGYDVYNYMTSEPDSIKDQTIDIRDQNIYLRSNCVGVSDYTSWEEENAFLQKLVPTQAIRDLIAPFDLQGHIAAHIRMEGASGLDTHAYEREENWTKEEHEVLHFWREKSNYRHFINKIDQLFAEDVNAKLFLATDMAETYQQFKLIYGDRVTFLERSIYDRSKEQLVYALADAILLSRCDRFLGSTWSSFSEIAMRLTKGYSSIEMSGDDF